MSKKRHNARAGEDQNGRSGDNIRRQQQESRDPEHRNARDRSGRKGGDNANNLLGISGRAKLLDASHAVTGLRPDGRVRR